MKRLAMIAAVLGGIGCGLVLFLQEKVQMGPEAARAVPGEISLSVAKSAPEEQEKLPGVSIPKEEHSLEAIEKAKSLDEFHREYVNYKDAELKEVLGWSKSRLEDTHLIEKSGKGSLNYSETYVLITEMRRQAAIHNILTDRELEKIERKKL